ncbi:hypothetical protein, partial [Modicisalibacter tunisiensis]
ALAREIRTHGIAVGRESNQVLEEGNDERAATLSEAAAGIFAIAERLEGWRRHEAVTLRELARTTTAQRAALEEFECKDGPDMRPREKVLFHKAANLTEGNAQALASLAQQLDPQHQEES